MKVLLVGFERWGSYSSNPSQQVAEKLNGKVISGAKVTSIILPVNFRTLSLKLKDAISKSKPDILITMGLSFRKKDKILIETIARRKIKPHFPDNYGKWPNDSKKETNFNIVNEKKAPLTRRTTLPSRLILKRLKEAKIPSAISRKAGGHMCEQVFYLGQHFMEKEGLNGLSGHIHMPLSKSNMQETRGTKFMELNKMIKGVEIAIRESVLELKRQNNK